MESAILKMIINKSKLSKIEQIRPKFKLIRQNVKLLANKHKI